MTNVPTAKTELLSKIQRVLVGKNKSKIKHDTLCDGYENGGLKSVDIFSKIVSLQCSWIKRLCDENFHPWKIIPLLYVIEMHFGKNFKFHPNLDLRNFSLKIFRKYYQEIIYRYSKYLSSPPSLSSSIVSQFLWLNKDIKIDNKHVIFSNFSKNGINFVGQLFDSDWKLHCWEFLKEKYILSQNMKFQWFQLIHALLREWKEAISMHDGSLENLLIQDHHLIKKNQILCLTKLNNNELYKIQIIIKYKKPMPQSLFEKIFKNSNLDWKTLYLLPYIATVDMTIHVFQ